ncbi:MAG: DUF2461 domain-containing protein [Deltaproteobacteria bacterium]|nr:DUF2461 domain-containing protein [Deltaproteobacteria bacterium]
MSKVRGAYFSSALFEFFSDLEANNDKAWFEANRQRYERDVKAPVLAFIAEIGPDLAKVSPRFVADPRPNGGSMFRIHRDVRFSKDKTPYKTHAAVHFRHDAGKDVHAPGFYLHLAPAEVFLGAGIWRPEPKTLGAIRDAIVAKPADYERASGEIAKKGWALAGESLTRVPRGYDPSHPAAEALKRKDHTALKQLSLGEAQTADFRGDVVQAYRAALPFNGFLAAALGLQV